MLTSKKFVLSFLLIFFSLTIGIIWTNRTIDFYGLFHKNPSTPKRLFRHERSGKYLLSMRYIPENFDSILLGSSSSLLLDTKQLANERIYNASLNGANISEIRLLIDNILSCRKPKRLILSLSPYLFLSHGPKTDFMVPRLFWTALGSSMLVSEYLYWLRTRLGLMTNGFDDYGRYDYMRDATNTPVAQQIEQAILKVKENKNSQIQEEAIEELRALVAVIRNAQVPVSVIYPPVPEPYFLVTQKDWTRMKNETAILFSENEILLDMTNPSFKSYRENISYFKDNGHVNEAGQQAWLYHLQLAFQRLQ